MLIGLGVAKASLLWPLLMGRIVPAPGHKSGGLLPSQPTPKENKGGGKPFLSRTMAAIKEGKPKPLARQFRKKRGGPQERPALNGLS